MNRRLFGTDGIRGTAGQFPLDPPTVFAIGLAVGEWVRQHSPTPEIVMGMDPRESSPSLAGYLAAGLRRSGAALRFAGLISTPGIAWLARSGSFAAGIMISASHNPYQDNGIKIFSPEGYKLPDHEEHALEERIFALLQAGVSPVSELPPPQEGLDRAYLDFLAATFPDTLSGVRLVVDGANGSASHLAPELFRRLGATVVPVACQPDGRNINRDCGSLYLEHLRKWTLAQRADLGVAFDGDADRALFVSSSGRVVDGDAVLFLAARHLHRHGRLARPGRPPLVVATVMSNLGLEEALARVGIRMLRAPVGDKYVLEEMLRVDALLGGEQSGHIIFREYATTGDGLLTALRLFEVLRASQGSLDELLRDLVLYPQQLINVPVRAKPPLEELPQVAAEIAGARREFGDSGRILVRYSGTEMLARVMVEGPDGSRVEHWARRIAEAIRAALA
jgi:phosphoglucosamine mutase